jgi:hypothetical protein
MLDTSRLNPAERALYRQMFPNGIRPGVRAKGPRGSSLDALWIFVVFSYKMLGTVPAVAVETLDAQGYRPQLEPRLWEATAPIRRARWARQRRTWRTLVLMHVRRAELRAQRERLVVMLVAEGERARRARRRRRLLAAALGGLVVASLVLVIAGPLAWS